MHVFVTKCLVPQQKKVWRKSPIFILIRENLQIDLIWRIWGNIIESKGNREIWLGIIHNLERLFTIQGDRITLVTNSEGVSSSSTSTEQSFRYQ